MVARSEEEKLIMGLDVSTKTIGIALFNMKGKLLELTHISPKIKPVPENKHVEMMLKSDIFKQYIVKYRGMGIQRIIIEEPLLYSNNINTVGTLTKFNGLISRVAYDELGVMPEYIPTYDARSQAFPELVAMGKSGKMVLFGGLPMDVDKKMVIWEKVKVREPQLQWIYDKKDALKKENFDMSDAYCVVLGAMKRDGLW
jgi:RNase H-fold protein (predicted Holliday junction resolvase)